MEYLHFVNTWSLIVLNSFFRALKGALAGHLTVDLLPGDRLQFLLRSHPKFESTIYVEDPTMLYKVTKFQLVSDSSNPPNLDVILTVPRIPFQHFGHLTVDLLLGDRLMYLLRSHPELESTIYVEDPTMLYKVTKVQLVSDSSNPPAWMSYPLYLESFFHTLGEFVA
ncbi:hypothetical protein JTB14_018661 [Gonioctena quinquepunctata]|nr:hypothetical protein JTB14_018661 [Gonioctena quinquepunctata]